MDKLDKNNKIRESFENNLPDDLPPDLLWENFSKQLDNASSEETAEKVKESFEHGFEQELLPVFLWSDIAEKLDQQTVSEGYKIKESFEEAYKNELPLDRWDELENQLEVETVWKKVHTNLNQNTKKHYWREKAMQLGIAVLAIFWLRGCGVGEPFIKHFVTEPPQNTIVSTTPISENQENVLNSNTIIENQNKENNSNSKPEKSLIEDNLKTKKDDILNVRNVNSPQDSYLKKQNSNKNNPKNKNTTKQGKLEISKKNGSNPTPAINTPTTSESNKETELASPLAKNDEGEKTKEQDINNDLAIDAELMGSKILETNAVDVLTAEELTNPTTNPNQIQDFFIGKKRKKIRFEPHFEIGGIGKMGTSILLCGATDEAIKEKSMLKTQMRLSGAVGFTFHAFFTKNDALILSGYPYSSHQQYFGGYTRDGRFYNKEIKLTYYTFSAGYQRTLFNYNKRKAPSALYIRAEYEYGYLREYVELMDNMPLKATNNAYKKENHSIGLSLGNTHRIHHFAIDYGIYANMGLSSVLDSHKEKALPVMETPQLMNMGGYIGLRYVF